MRLSFPQKGLREVRGCLPVLSDPTSSPWKRKLIIKIPLEENSCSLFHPFLFPHTWIISSGSKATRKYHHILKPKPQGK